jgi:tRNA A-37 threonylcarbamoyl transferase component Bud32
MSQLKINSKIAKDLKGIIPEFRIKDRIYNIRKLQSRKNTVIEIEFEKKPKNYPKQFIIKIFRTKNIVSEINILNRLKNQNFRVPEILNLKKPYLIMEKINGVNLCDFINDNLKGTLELDDIVPEIKNQLINSIEKLAEWLAQLHEKNIVRKPKSEEILVLNKGDTRLRDFIIDPSEEILYGVDFEDAYEGNNMDDLAWICCSLLDTSPGLFDMDEPKHKIELINRFLKKYYQVTTAFQFDFGYLAEKMIEHLNIVIQRRNLPFGPISKSSFIEDISKEV